MSFLISLLALGLFAAPVWAADATDLDCSGTSSNYEQNILNATVRSASIQINWDTQIVMGPFDYHFRITQIDDASVEFTNDLLEHGAVTGHFSGHVNRLNGDAMIYAQRHSDKNKVMLVFELKCKPAKPLF